MIQRESYMKQIRPFMGNEIIKVLTGIRRCGKSVMLELIKEELLNNGVLKEQFISINFEDMDNSNYCTAEALHSYVSEKIKKSKNKTYLFFDEIQEVKEWEKCINSLRVKFDCDIYITGSNAKLLSGELATYLAGRYVEFVIYPFSFKEFCELQSTKEQNILSGNALKQYIHFGGMPFLSNLNYIEEPCNQYLKDVYNSVVLKDVVKRNKIRDVDLLERIITYVMANIGQPFSATSMTKYFKNEKRTVSPETILNYMGACEEAFLFYRVPRQDLAGKKILAINEKYYIADHGIREAAWGKNVQDINQILENIVYMELRRRGYHVTIGKINGLEVDFACENKKDKIYVQVAYLLASPETINREFNSLKLIKDNYPKYVVSMDEFDMSQDGIRHYNLSNFLLNNIC